MFCIMLVDRKIHSPVYSDIGLLPSGNHNAGGPENNDVRPIEFGMRGRGESDSKQ